MKNAVGKLVAVGLASLLSAAVALADPAALKAADPDNDGTLDAKEYAKVVESKFKAADPDNDGTLDEKELSSPAGAALLKLIH